MSDETIPTVEALADQVRRLRATVRGLVIALVVVMAIPILYLGTRETSQAASEPTTFEECRAEYRRRVMRNEVKTDQARWIWRRVCEKLPVMEPPDKNTGRPEWP